MFTLLSDGHFGILVNSVYIHFGVQKSDRTAIHSLSVDEEQPKNLWPLYTVLISLEQYWKEMRITFQERPLALPLCGSGKTVFDDAHRFAKSL